MIFIKLLLITILTVVFLLITLSSRFRTYQRLFIIFGYGALAFFILFPSIADKVAEAFGIERGADLVVYIAIAILALLSTVLYAQVKIHERAITKIVRDIAIMKSRKCE